ncbi:YggS family pyridoxal phosphate-dependent enzyme [Vagococcus sp. PNs007]|uniref:Pyridoxal phosphate homeostasis protein n=1 Tax=Vagococcus proximus TaxID=2991417 RepID=A0ABT5X0A2_9ENTE|nr:YggS family pyridoxal phosphate-dependent enzyme [Vagococcus proximus]MDF0479432.1 YggS family pyridoxal phosphate-dependent enzyme [Vagococcus proximus]
MSRLEKNVLSVQETIDQACQSVGRNAKDVVMLAVTKSVSSEVAAPLLELGITKFAENRVDSLLEKQLYFQENKIEWHLIGTLQRRKVKKVINSIDYFHALDSLKLAEEIQKHATQTIKCFVQVNVSNEESKHGLIIEDTINFIKSIEKYDKIKIVGLMTMAPKDATEVEINYYFNELALKCNEIRELDLDHAPCTELSMGMSNDYELAVKSGSTYVRIGTAFFKDYI